MTMTATDAYAELGGAADDLPRRKRPAARTVGTSAPRTPQHCWQLIAAQHGLTRHRCNRCLAIRTRINQGADFPRTKYLTRDNQHSAKAPACRPCIYERECS
jgi:hypothetical protein